MVKLINSFTNTEMWVADNRVEEYTAAGHKPAAAPEIPAEPPKAEVKKTTRKKKG